MAVVVVAKGRCLGRGLFEGRRDGEQGCLGRQQDVRANVTMRTGAAYELEAGLTTSELIVCVCVCACVSMAGLFS